MSNKIIAKRVDSIIKNNSLSYASYVIQNRALPMLEDGMKPVYRRILWTMHKMNATKFTKSNNISGQVMKYHPHGDSYPTMVGMAQKDNHLTPLIVGKGNFAQHTSRDLQPGAGRYTEAKLSPIAIDIFKGLNKNVVEFVQNYDGTAELPAVLPVKFPLILHMAQEGIAYGMANKMPSFNIKDICEATKTFIKTGEKNILIPDFATGGMIVKDEAVFKKINSEGKGSIRIRAKAEIEGNVISIVEIPYSTTREAIIEKIIKLDKDKQISGITSIKDLTGLNGMRIEITCKKSVDAKLLLEQLYKSTTLEDSYSCNMNILYNGLPQVMGTWEIIEKWIEWRIGCIERQLKGEVDKLTKEYNIYKGFEEIVKDIDKAINIIRNSDEETIIKNIMTEFKINEVQAEYITNMKFKNINENYMKKKIVEIENMAKEIEEKENIIKDRNKKLEIIIQDLQEIEKKYGADRRSQIIELDEQAVKTTKKAMEKQANNYNVTLFITKEGYVKKVQKVVGTNKLKPGDEIIQEFKTTNSGELVVFSGTDAYKIQISSLTDCKMSDFGDYIPAIIGVKDFVGFTIVDDKHKFIIVCYDNGKIAKVDLNSFRTATNRKKLSNSLFAGAKVLSIETFECDKDIVVVCSFNKRDKENVINTSKISMKTSRATQGIKVLRNIKYIKKSSEQQIKFII